MDKTPAHLRFKIQCYENIIYFSTATIKCMIYELSKDLLIWLKNTQEICPTKRWNDIGTKKLNIIESRYFD